MNNQHLIDLLLLWTSNKFCNHKDIQSNLDRAVCNTKSQILQIAELLETKVGEVVAAHNDLADTYIRKYGDLKTNWWISSIDLKGIMLKLKGS